MNKAFWSHFRHFGRMLGKHHLFLTPSRTDRRVPSEQGAPTRTLQPDLLGSFPADVCPKITGQFGSDYSANKYHIAGTLDNKSSKTPCTVSFPATLSLQGHIIFPKCPSHQNFNCMQNRYYEEQIHRSISAIIHDVAWKRILFSIFDKSINRRWIWTGSVAASNEKVNLQKSLFYSVNKVPSEETKKQTNK